MSPPTPHTASDSLRKRLDDIYTPLEEAVEELHNRRRRFQGKTPGMDWLPSGCPVSQQGGAFLFRVIATPNFETKRFLHLADECGLTPVIGEYHSDKYASCNPIKRALLKPKFLLDDKIAVTQSSQVEQVCIVKKTTTTTLCDMKTKKGKSLVAFHHEWFAAALNGSKYPLHYDYSQKYAHHGAMPSLYYAEQFRMAIADGIVFEDYLLNECEFNFTKNVVLPAFDEVTERFGMRPLIVRLSSPEEEDSPHWFWYPRELIHFVKKRC